MSRIALIVLWLSFAGWVGWMYWTAHRHGRFDIVSHAQLLTADVAVVAEIKAEADERPVQKVKVESVVWPVDGAPPLAGRELEIANLAGSDGFHGAGRYVLLLSGQADGSYRLAVMPKSPLLNPSTRPKIYPSSAEVVGQLREAPGRSLRAGG